ncbi:alpha/beta hydrolase fold protein [Dendrothele bispora CBS 962.96]|uniref:Alpha/beta hydrolase fold protein n=1 Tax=Dendrothele bispora (strain CBS 962.96) TaxID=1314807 RepID=A0A4S8M9T8_DENBC|nr:alpha/beta hydrolase fold protein [Dendrothele bispora CBS 962.96]
MTQSQLSTQERLHLLTKLAGLPMVMLCSLFTSLFKQKPLKRIIFDASVRYMTSGISIPQMQSFSEGGVATFRQWSKQMRFEPHIEEIGKDARLFWLGPKSADQVVLYVPGGGFMAPVTDYMITFFDRIRQALMDKMHSKGVAVAILDYSLYPQTFPTQLVQLTRAIEYLFSLGIKPTNLQLVGDSAGANLILQLLSHTLHPVLEIPPSPLRVDGTGQIRGVCLISPWVAINEASPSHFENDPYDVVSSRSLLHWGSAYLAEVPGFLQHYVKVNGTPKNWFEGIDKVVTRILITVGGNEVLRDDGVRLNAMLAKAHPEVRIDVQAGGVHDDPILDSGAKIESLSYVAQLMIAWFAAEH